MSKKAPIVDLKLDITYLTSAQTLELINASISDGFNVLALSRTINPKVDYVPSKIDKRPFESQSVKILERVTLKVGSTQDLDTLKSKKSNLEQADIVALEFNDVETFEAFIKRYNDFIDNLVYINISTFPVSTHFLKLLKNKNLFIELDYSKFFIDAKKKQALVNFYKLLDSHYDQLILSSDAGNLLDRRAEWEIKAMVNSLLERSENYSSKLAKCILSDTPLKLIKRCLLRKQGFAYFE